MKRYDSYKECVITTPTDEFTQIFSTDWTFSDIESWMLDTYCIEKDSILSLRISNVTLYKLKKNGNN